MITISRYQRNYRFKVSKEKTDMTDINNNTVTQVVEMRKEKTMLKR